MSLSTSQLIESADTSGDALRLIRAARDLTQADIVARSEDTIGADQISLIERGKRPMTSKQCTAIARALNLTDAQEAQLMLMALIDRKLVRVIAEHPLDGDRIGNGSCELVECHAPSPYRRLLGEDRTIADDGPSLA